MATEPLATKALSEDTWPDFARLVEANNGVWGGCWCMAFHADGAGCAAGDAPDPRRQKQTLVREGATHAALVFDGVDCVGWCQFGKPADLPRIKSRRAYNALHPDPADWRITCLFVGKGHRNKGVADAALGGALELITELGGGTVESFPEDTAGRKVAGSFLHNGTLASFERHGFQKDRKIGKHRWLVHKNLS